MSERALGQIERDVFTGFYSVRKLMEKPGALTDATRDATWQCAAFPNIAPVTILNNHRFHELYNLSSCQQLTKDLGFFCHQIVHSFIFEPYLDKYGNFKGVLFASDRAKNSTLYGVSTDTLISIFWQVGTDYPRTVVMEQDLETRAVTVTAT